MTRITVTGATGAVGGIVARRLAERGIPQQLIVRHRGRAPDLPGAEVTEIAGYHDGPALERALAGTQTLLLVSGEEAKDRLEQHRTAVRAAAAAGVQRIVYTSFLGAAPEATFTLARDHFHTERAIVGAGIALSALRNSLYQDVLPYFVVDGAIRGPAGDGRFAPIARRDVAEVALECLLADDPPPVLELTGPERLDMHAVARALSDAQGTPVHYLDETPEEARRSRAHLGEPWQVEAWVSSYAAIAAGELDVLTDAVERMTGSPARSFTSLLREG